VTAPAPPGDGTDELLDRIDQGVPPSSPEEAAARAPFERLLARVRDLPPLPPEPGWERRAHQRWAAARADDRRRRRRQVGLAIGGLAAAAIVLVLVLGARGARSPRATGLEVAVLDRNGAHERGAPGLHGTLRVKAPQRQPHGEVRVYRDARLLVRCPGAPTCRATPDAIALDLDLDQPGVYQVVALSSRAPIPAPGDGGLDGDLLAARRAGANVERDEPTRVQP